MDQITNNVIIAQWIFVIKDANIAPLVFVVAAPGSSPLLKNLRPTYSYVFSVILTVQNTGMKNKSLVENSLLSV